MTCKVQGRWRPKRRIIMYYFVRSCVRWSLLMVLLGSLTYCSAKVGESWDDDIPDCIYHHYPCPWDTTIPDPYFDPRP